MLSKQCDKPKRRNSIFLKATKWDYSCQLRNIEGQKYPQNMVFKKKEPYFRCSCCTQREIPLPEDGTNAWYRSNPPWPHGAHWNITNSHSYFRFVQNFWKGKFELGDLIETECCFSLLVYLYAKYSCLPVVSKKVILCALGRNSIMWIVSSDQICAVDDPIQHYSFSKT